MARKSRKRLTVAVNDDYDHGAKIYNTAVYARLSVEDIRKKTSDSIGTQKAMLRDYIKAQPDLQLYNIYEDVNYTGTNFERPGFCRMLEEIESGFIDCVLVKDLSRFGRNFLETGHLLERVFPLLGVRFISIGDGYDSLIASSDDGSLLVPLKNLINGVYARDISRKVQSSVRLKQECGQFCGSIAPYGYLKDGPSLVIDEEAARVVHQIFRWILDGLSDISVAQKLNDLKIPPPSRYRFEKGITKTKKYQKSGFWYKSTVKRISENPAYTGVMAQGKCKSNFLHGGGIIQTNYDEWVIVKDTHPAIIDSETYDAVQGLREARKQRYTTDESRSAPENIFKGLIFCGGCKSFMSRSRIHHIGANDEYFFLCNVYEQVDKHACTKKKIPEADIKTSLYMAIGKQIKLAVEIDRIISDIAKLNAHQRCQDKLMRHINEVQMKLVQNRRYRTSLWEKYIDGILVEQDIVTMQSECDEERDRFQQELDMLQNEKQYRDSVLSTETKWITEYRRFEEEQYLSAMMVAALVERIEVYDSARIEIHLRCRDEFEAISKDVNDIKSETINE